MEMKRNKKRLLAIVACLFVASGTAQAKDTDQQSTGPITSLTSTSITVQSLQCALTTSTEYEDGQSNKISRSRLEVGTPVRLRCRDGKARNVSLLSGSGSSSSSSSNSSESSESSSSSSSAGSSSSSASGSPGNGGNNGSSKDRNIRSSFSPLAGVSTSLNGKVRFQSSERGKEQKLTGSLELPVPSTFPAASTLVEARVLLFSVTFFRTGTAFARCVFESDDSDNKESATSAEFALDVRKNKAKVRSKKGSCDLDMSDQATKIGVPVLKKGDSVIVEEAVAGVLLEATL